MSIAKNMFRLLKTAARFQPRNVAGFAAMPKPETSPDILYTGVSTDLIININKFSYLIINYVTNSLVLFFQREILEN